MRKTLQDLHNGRIMPYEQKHIQSKKYHEAVKRMAEIEEQFLGMLDDSGKGVLEAYQDAQADATVEREMANFAYGFRLCANLFIESLDRDPPEKQLTNT